MRRLSRKWKSRSSLFRFFRAGSGNVVGATGSATSGGSAASVNGGVAHKGPDEDKIKEILDRTGYTLDVTTGQRKFGGPPPGWEGEPPSKGCEVSCAAAVKPELLLRLLTFSY